MKPRSNPQASPDARLFSTLEIPIRLVGPGDVSQRQQDPLSEPSQTEVTITLRLHLLASHEPDPGEDRP